MTARLLPITIGLAAILLAMGYAVGGVWKVLPILLAVAALWWIGQRRHWNLVASVALLGFVVAAALGLWMGLPAGWMLAGVVAALSAWDLDHFARRLRRVERVEMQPALERLHLRRLTSVDSLGLLLAGMALVVQYKFSFDVALVLGLVAVLGLSQVVSYLRRESD
jgi:hypothetical protein